jgi:PAS domain S-box-containing protein
MNYVYYVESYDATKQQVFNQLTINRDLKRDMILDYFDEVKQELKSHSYDFIRKIEMLHPTKPFDMLRLICLDMCEDDDIDIEKYSEISADKDSILELKQSFDDVVRINKIFLEEVDGENLYIIDNSGDIVFSEQQCFDFLRNIYEEDFKDEGIVECVEKLKERRKKGFKSQKAVFTDFSYYKFHSNVPVFFAGIELKVNKEIGYLVMMITARDINDIMTRWWELGTGGTREAFVAGSDFKMRSDSRFLIEEPEEYFKILERVGVDKEKIKLMKSLSTTVLIQEIIMEATIDAFKGNTDTRIINDYRNIPVVCSWTPVNIDDIKWAIMSKVDVEEAFSDMKKLRADMLFFSLTFMLFLLVGTAILVERMTKRVISLKKGAERVSAGDYNFNIIAKGDDEIDELMKAFNKMTINLKVMGESQKIKASDLEKMVDERTKEFNLAKEFSEKIIYTAASLIVVTDRSGRIFLVNDAFVNITGYTEDELLGKEFFNLLYEDKQEKRFKNFLKVGGEEKSHFDCKIKTKRYGDKMVSWDAAVVTPMEGDELMISIGQDITDRITLQNDLRKKTKEMESFVYTVSHDLKNPTISLMGILDIFIKDYCDKINVKGKFYLERIKVNAGIINDLLTGLLEISRIGRIEDSKEKVDVNGLIQHIIEENQEYIEENNIKVEIDENLPKIIFSKIRLYQIFSNLFKNALKFMRKGVVPEIKIGYEETANEYIFHVSDNGIGIDEEYHSTIFDMFSRLREKEVEGTGIGLTIVKRIIDDSGGRIWLESKKNEGTTFYIAIAKKMGYDIKKLV